MWASSTPLTKLPPLHCEVPLATENALPLVPELALRSAPAAAAPARKPTTRLDESGVRRADVSLAGVAAAACWPRALPWPVSMKVAPRGPQSSLTTAVHSSTMLSMCGPGSEAETSAGSSSTISAASAPTPMTQRLLSSRMWLSGVRSSRTTATKAGGPSSAGISRRLSCTGNSAPDALRPKATYDEEMRPSPLAM